MNKTLVSPPSQCCVPLAATSLGDNEAEATAAVFKALSDPQRVRIVNLLANSDEPVCVCDITDVVGLSQGTVSFHLKKLVSAGLLNREERGTWAYYALEDETLKRLDGLFTMKKKRSKK